MDVRSTMANAAGSLRAHFARSAAKSDRRRRLPGDRIFVLGGLPGEITQAAGAVCFSGDRAGSGDAMVLSFVSARRAMRDVDHAAVHVWTAPGTLAETLHGRRHFVRSCFRGLLA